MSNSKASNLIKEHKLPCGPMTLAVNTVCRKRLKDKFDTLLDRLCEECHPEPVKPQAPKGHEFDDKGRVVESNRPKTRNEKKKEMIESGKLRAEVQTEIKKYKEQLMGNSRLSQDITGEIKPR
jgi:hypothetical protein